MKQENRDFHREGFTALSAFMVTCFNSTRTGDGGSFLPSAKRQVLKTTITGFQQDVQKKDKSREHCVRT